ncbi:microtubule-associated protein 6 homolog [Conger conger]|uniref:microtubule-associated protein 6 homolog n=1 Tax=Conger conger TaxID=82655 RepID=UPI002A599AE6|nr:microtubule-associated protein 6 homolog [Conger conger]
MAWPCITRACCINRFWSDFDKADIAVPLVFTKYSDVTEVQRLHFQPQPKQPHPQARPSAVAIETQPSHREHDARAPPATGGAAASAAGDASASVTRQDFKAWKVRPEPSFKPKNEYHRSETPFNNETQYQKDFKPWPIPRRGDHPWIPKPSPGPSKRPPRPKSAPAQTEDESGVEKSVIADKVQEKDIIEKKKLVKKDKVPERRVSIKIERPQPGGVAVEGKGRAAADALNQKIKKEVAAGSSYRNEFKAYKDVKPVKPIKAKSQYKPLIEEKSSLETSYSATFRGEQVKQQPADNKALERRRIRSLYSEPGKEPSKVEKPSTPRSKPKKTTTTTGHGKPAKKAKDKPASSVRGSKKKTPESPVEARPEAGNKEKSKEINNKLAEAKE